MEEVIKNLEKCCESMEELKLIAELLNKYGTIEVVQQKLLQKKIEDGMLNNLHNANEYQLNMLKDRSYRFFKFYDIKDIDPIIDIAIVNNDRRRKINRLKEKICLNKTT